MNLPEGIPFDVPGLWDDYERDFHSRGIDAPSVVIHGGYGKNNLGDDAILNVLIGRTLARFPKARITVVCHGPDNVERFYQGQHITACHFKSVAALRAMVRSDLYIIGGGGIINRINTYSGRRRLRLLDMKGKFLFIAALVARAAGAKTHFYAIGAESFPDAGVKLLARFALQGASLVSVRDPLSLSNLKEIGVTRPIVQVLDPALSLQASGQDKVDAILRRAGVIRSRRKLVCIGFRYVRDDVTDNDEKVRAVVRLVKYLIQVHHCDVIFLPASQHPSVHYEDDLHFGRQVRRLLGAESQFFLIEEYHPPSEVMALLGSVDLCIVERLHAAILASLTGVPLCIVSYDDKVTEYAKLVGLQQRLVPSSAFAEDLDASFIDSYIESSSPREVPIGN